MAEPNDQPTIIEARPGSAAAPAAATPEELANRADTSFALEVPADPATLPLYRLGDYELLQEVGRGGMGVVFRARHLKLNRIVALKMILGGALARADDLQRFNTEAAAAAQLQHPGIVALYEAGTFDNQPYFSMEYVQGSSLAQLTANGSLPGRRAAAYLEQTARAVHYAHRRGILHRDLKPANILVDEQDQPKITDFGLAKLIQTDSGQTRTGTVVGTPSYMSPEQAAASKDVGPSADIYSLGAILYELITGRPPFKGETALQTLTMVAEDEPVSPRSISKAIDVDLETICLKCLAKEPARRYATAELLADDLRRYLDGDAITARPLGRLGRALVWCRRRPTEAALWGVSLAALLAVVSAVFAFAVLQGESAREERKLRQDAEAAKQLAQDRFTLMSRLYYLAEMRQAQQALTGANLGRATLLLEKYQRDPQLRDWEWYYLWNQAHGRFTLEGHPGSQATAVAYRPDGARLASAGNPPAKDATIKIWDAHTGKLLQTLTGHTNRVRALAYSPDGRLMIAASDDQTVKIWNADTGALVATLPHGARVASLAVHPGGKLLATGDSAGKIRLWSMDNLEAHQPDLAWTGHTGEVGALAFSPDPDGQWLASGGQDWKIHLWATSTGAELKVFPRPADDGARPRLGHQGPVNSVVFTGGGKLLVSAGGPGSRAGEILVWDVDSGDVRHTLIGLHFLPVGLAVHPQGTLAVACKDGWLRIWPKVRPDAAAPFAGEPIRVRGDAQQLYGVAFSRDGRQLACAGADGKVRTFNAHGGQESLTLPSVPACNSVAFSGDGKRFAAAVGPDRRPGEVHVWSLAQPGKTLFVLPHPRWVRAVALNADGTLLATGCDDNQVRLYDLTGEHEPRLLKNGHTAAVTCVAFSPDGRLLASGGEDEVIRLWNLADNSGPRVLSGHGEYVLALAFSPSSEWLVSGSGDKTVRLWDVGAGTQVILGLHDTWTRTVAFSADGKRVASAGFDKQIRIWRLDTRLLDRTLDGSAAGVLSVAFHPDGWRLASAGEDRVVRLWDLVTGQEILEWEGSTGHVRCVTFSQDGRWLAAAGEHPAIRLWEAPRP
jgi:WD40 repeat protein/tRNA A-37 threonylcarbamoyl transferase component Bud32